MQLKKLILLLLLYFCNTQNIVLANNNILILGDSISAAYGINPDKGWANLLQQKLKKSGYSHQVYNASTSGDTTSNGLQKLKQLLPELTPEIVIVELGGNDGLRGHPLSLMQKNLTLITELSKQQNTKVLLLGIQLPPNYGKSFTEKFQQVYVHVSKSEQVALVPDILKDIGGVNSLMQADGVHPKENAQAIMLSHVWPKLEQLILKGSAR